MHPRYPSHRTTTRGSYSAFRYFLSGQTRRSTPEGSVPGGLSDLGLTPHLRHPRRTVTPNPTYFRPGIGVQIAKTSALSPMVHRTCVTPAGASLVLGLSSSHAAATRHHIANPPPSAQPTPQPDPPFPDPGVASGLSTKSPRACTSQRTAFQQPPPGRKPSIHTGHLPAQRFTWHYQQYIQHRTPCCDVLALR